MKRKDLIKRLEAAGFTVARDNGNHTIYSAPGKPPVPVPRHTELNEFTAKSILKAAGLL